MAEQGATKELPDESWPPGIRSACILDGCPVVERLSDTECAGRARQIPPSPRSEELFLQKALDPGEDFRLVDAVGVACPGTVLVDDERVDGQDRRPIEDGSA